MLTRLMTAFALLFAAPLALPSVAQAQDRGGLPTIACNSWNYQPARCAANLGYGGAAYLRQVVAGQCGPLGSNWGWDGQGVWVKGGCRGIFAIQYGGSGGGGYPGGGGGFQPGPVMPGPGAGWRSVRCESFNYQPARCAVDVLGPPHIQQQIAGQCIRTQTWDYDRGGITVRGGCRAIFAVPAGYPGGGGGGYPGGGGGYPGGGGGPNYGGRTIACNSWNYQPARCPAATWNGVQLVSVVAGECIRGRTWGFDQNGIWVNSGCRAIFRTPN